MSIAAHSIPPSKTSSGRAPGAPSRANAERPADFAAMVAPQRSEPAPGKPADRVASPDRTDKAAPPQRPKPQEDRSPRAGSARSDDGPAPSPGAADTAPAPDAAAQGSSDAQGSDTAKDAATEAALAEAAAVDEDHPQDEANVAPADVGAAIAANAPAGPAAPPTVAAPPVPVPPAPTAADVPPGPTPEQAAAIGAAQGRRGAPRTADAAATVAAKGQPSAAGASPEAASDGPVAAQPQPGDGQPAPTIADASGAPAEAKAADPTTGVPAGAAAPDLSRLGDGAPPPDPAQTTGAPPAGAPSAPSTSASGAAAAKEAGKPAGSAERPARRGAEDAAQAKETIHDGKPGAGSAAETFQALVLDTTAPTGAGKPAAEAAGAAAAGPAADPRAAAATPTPLSAVPIEIGMRAMAGAQSFQIRLHPEEYGRVDVKLDIDRDGAVTAQLVVDRVETLTLLQRDAKTLERAFEQAGLKTAENALQFSLSSNNGGQNPQQDQAGRQPGGRRVLPSDGDGQAPAEISAALRAFRSSSGGLDIRI